MVVRYTREEDWQELKRIRLAALLDAPTAFGVTHASAAAYTDTAWQDRAAGRGPARYLLAFQDGVAVGIVGHVPVNAQTLGLIAMWVAPEVRGTGIAKSLVQAVQSHAALHNYARVTLDVSPENSRAAAFYLKQGFTFLPEWEALESHPAIQLQKMAWRQISIGVATEAELAAVAGLYQTVGYGGGVSATDVTLCAKEGTRLAGAVRLCKEEGVMVLRGMHVHPDFQRQGIGSLLLTHCIPYLSQGESYCLPYDHLVQFYEQAGFRIAAVAGVPPFLAERLKDYLASGQQIVAMKHPWHTGKTIHDLQRCADIRSVT
ncbi:GNAT family N-acetyltransferase [Duganella sp. CY15W]|uniref:GNAT family N-acetyltransferase n=1 Tax=Duganella sp. CY15W TaxID=2692172 RepID=UPI00136E4D87|nr:GNAT family N-acetyltransferase [Duganella sp. CY15W]MYM27642.1 GNAT family N-acetyltransferase [Duganella sp. CY15W]